MSTENIKYHQEDEDGLEAFSVNGRKTWDQWTMWKNLSVSIYLNDVLSKTGTHEAITRLDEKCDFYYVWTFIRFLP